MDVDYVSSDERPNVARRPSVNASSSIFFLPPTISAAMLHTRSSYIRDFMQYLIFALLATPYFS